eukprot:TRINITY_DN6389_c0_g2_i1.p1 TRINITY_DN6389_c0_g2~~TRINITY_DN6389_c0_g2_i1.p1  ORF type:complete len:182 (+),score=52.52 TRINITY_DN6389_c0_g2_i1:166-711(+)
MVTLENATEYVGRVVQALLADGVAHQLDAFSQGFETVFPMQALSVFSVDELDDLLSGTERQLWTYDALMESINCDHGYTHNSQAVKDLVSVMTTFSAEDKRQFVMFLTGSPKLPIGGFKGLNPKFTVVQKQFSASLIADHFLPSVNCCFYYLKLPAYSSKEIVRRKLLYTIYNGQGSFDLT